MATATASTIGSPNGAPSHISATTAGLTIKTSSVKRPKLPQGTASSLSTPRSRRTTAQTLQDISRNLQRLSAGVAEFQQSSGAIANPATDSRESESYFSTSTYPRYTPAFSTSPPSVSPAMPHASVIRPPLREFNTNSTPGSPSFTGLNLFQSTTPTKSGRPGSSRLNNAFLPEESAAHDSPVTPPMSRARRASVSSNLSQRNLSSAVNMATPTSQFRMPMRSATESGVPYTGSPDLAYQPYYPPQYNTYAPFSYPEEPTAPTMQAMPMFAPAMWNSPVLQPTYPTAFAQPTTAFSVNADTTDTLDGASENPSDLTGFLSRVHGAMSHISSRVPEIQALCDGYQQLKDELGEARETLSQQEKQLEEFSAKEKRISHLSETLDKQTAEANKMRHGLNEARDAAKLAEEALQSQLEEVEKLKQDAVELIARNEKDKESLEEQHKQAVESQATTALNEKVELQQKLDGVQQELEAAKKSLDDERETHLANLAEEIKKLQESNDKALADAERIASEEKDALKADHKKALKTCEKRNEKTTKDAVKDAVKDAIKTTDAKYKAEITAMEVKFNAEKNMIEAQREEEKKWAQGDLENQKKQLESDLQEKHKFETDSLEAKISDLESKLTKLREEKISLQKTWDDEKDALEDQIADLEGTVEELSGLPARNEQLEKTLLQLENDYGESKRKGDSYFTNAFQALSKDIVDLSKSHFQNLPISPTADVLSSIPPELPPFTTNTAASKVIRSCYVQHVISKYLVYRIFTPFHFCLSGDRSPVDSYLQSVSDQLRNKSLNKEAVWRHHTLMSAYSAEGAKEETNVTAGNVAKEIMEKLKPFCDGPDSYTAVLAGVKRIVKQAVENWRYARLEREMISVRLAPCGDATDGSWPHADANADALPAVPAHVPESCPPGRVLLAVLPRFERERSHHNEADTTGCVFSEGAALWSQDPAVVHRILELYPPPPTPLPTPPPEEPMETDEMTAEGPDDADRAVEDATLDGGAAIPEEPANEEPAAEEPTTEEAVTVEPAEETPAEPANGAEATDDPPAADNPADGLDEANSAGIAEEPPASTEAADAQAVEDTPSETVEDSEPVPDETSLEGGDEAADGPSDENSPDTDAAAADTPDLDTSPEAADGPTAPVEGESQGEVADAGDGDGAATDEAEPITMQTGAK